MMEQHEEDSREDLEEQYAGLKRFLDEGRIALPDGTVLKEKLGTPSRLWIRAQLAVVQAQLEERPLTPDEGALIVLANRVWDEAERSGEDR